MSKSPYPSASVPYAQAAAVINADGTVQHAHGVVEVRRTADGCYSVEVSPTVDLARGVPLACLIGQTDASVPSQIYVNPHESGGDPHMFGVTTYAGAARADSPFTVIVP